MAPEDMREVLLASQVFVSVGDDEKIGGFQRSIKAASLSITAEDGTQVLILFPSPERAKSLFTWILARIGRGCVIALNPKAISVST